MTKTLDNHENTYKVNDTIVLAADVYAGDSKNSVDPDSITITSFTCDGSAVGLASYEFTRLAEGQYEIDLTTNHLSAGVYKYQVVVRGNLGQSIFEDVLIINPADPFVEPLSGNV